MTDCLLYRYNVEQNMERLSKYLENKNFIIWVFQPDEELEQWWKQFETNHPEEKRNILLARKVLSKFRTNNKELAEEEKILLFSKILKQIEEKRSGRSRQVTFGLLKYAAVALIFFSVGALVFYKQNTFISEELAQKLSEPIPSNSAKLIRANGENIVLKDDKSVLQYQADGKLVVNNDTLIAYISKPSIAAMNQLIIPYGKTSELLLSDGTKVFLNAGSRLIYPENFTSKSREVFLEGEAFFEVKRDQSHPFLVQVEDIRIKVMGTKFNISAYSSDNLIETALAEGKVIIEQNNAGLFEKGIELVPDQLASFDRTTRKIDIKAVDTDNYTLWTKGILKFESADLNRIVKQLERYYNIRFQISDPLLRDLRISGKLQLKEDKEETCERVARAASVRIVKKGDDLYEIIK